MKLVSRVMYSRNTLIWRRCSPASINLGRFEVMTNVCSRPLQLNTTKLLSTSSKSKTSRIIRKSKAHGHLDNFEDNFTKVIDLIPRCQSCGTPFQDTDPDKMGYYQEPKSSQRTKSFQDEKLTKHNELFNSMDTLSKAVYTHNILNGISPEAPNQKATSESSSEDINNINKLQDSPQKIIDKDAKPVLNVDDFSSTMFEKRIESSEKDKIRDTINEGLCTICRSHKGNKYVDLSSQIHPTTQEVLNMIPKDGRIIHVISGEDFPASYIPGIRKYAGDRKILYVVTKSDMVVDEQFKTHQRFLPYVQNELKNIGDISPENIFVVSAKLGWGLSNLFNRISSDTYLVGLPNTGKTALAHSLGKFNNVEKPDDITSLEFKRRLYGVSYLPKFTKCPISYINSRKRITDMPAVNVERGAIYEQIDTPNLKTVVDSAVFSRRLWLPATVSKTLTNNGSVMSLGGLVFIQMNNAPEKVHLVFWCVCGEHRNVIRRFESLEKATQISATQIDQHKSWFLNKPFDLENPEEVEKYQVREAFTTRIGGGGANYGILGLGSLIIGVTGRIPEEGVEVTFFVRPGVEVHERSPILKYMRDFFVENRKHNTGDSEKSKKKYDKKNKQKGNSNRNRNVKKLLDEQ